MDSETYTTQLGPLQLGYTGELEITSFRNKEGLIVHHYRGRDWGYAGAQGECDLDFLECGGPITLREAHERCVRLHNVTAASTSARSTGRTYES